MTNSEVLMWAHDLLVSSGEMANSEPMKQIKSIANKYSQYEELYSIFQKAQESLEDAKERLVEP